MKILQTAYFPPIEWFFHLMGRDGALIEVHENFIKQTYRNRCRILSSNGKLDLVIPVINDGSKTLITEKKISYAEQWQIKHWRAIESAYKNSPYFEYFEEEIKNVLMEREENLFLFNKKLIDCIFKILRVKFELRETEEYYKLDAREDLRVLIDPKVKDNLSFPEYYQVFKHKTGFVPNLSVLDLLFNEGLGTIDYLTKQIRPTAV